MKQDTKATSIIIADADHDFADSLEIMLDNSQYQVVHKIPKRKDLINFLMENPSDIVIIDYELSQDVKGDAIMEIRRRNPLQKLLMLTYYANLEVFEFCMEYSVNGFATKDSNKGEILEALKIISEGGFALPTPHKTEEEVLAEKPPELNSLGRKLKITLREMQILKLLIDGKTNQQIAKTLFRSQEDIDNYCQGMLTKVGVSQMNQLLSYAINLLF